MVYVPAFVLALNGPQPVIGLALSGMLAVGIMRFLFRRIPQASWAEARRAANGAEGEPERMERYAWPAALARTLVTDIGSVWWPLVLGVTLAAVIAAWGFTPAFFAVPGGEGVLGQGLSAAVGLVLAALSGVPPVGNIYPAAFFWKAEFFSYAGLMAFYLGVMVTPLAFPRYADLFGRALARRVIWRLGVAVVVSALCVTAFWYGLDWLLHAVGVAEPIEVLMDSTIKPDHVPWFHTLFWSHSH